MKEKSDPEHRDGIEGSKDMRSNNTEPPLNILFSAF